MMWLHPGVVPASTPASPVIRDTYALMGAFASMFAAPTCMGDQETLVAGEALVEEEWNWRWMR